MILESINIEIKIFIQNFEIEIKYLWKIIKINPCNQIVIN